MTCRIVHDTKKVIVLLEDTEGTITKTPHNIEDFETKEEAIFFINEKGLEYYEEDIRA